MCFALDLLKKKTEYTCICVCAANYSEGLSVQISKHFNNSLNVIGKRGVRYIVSKRRSVGSLLRAIFRQRPPFANAFFPPPAQMHVDQVHFRLRPRVRHQIIPLFAVLCVPRVQQARIRGIGREHGPLQLRAKLFANVLAQVARGTGGADHV